LETIPAVQWGLHHEEEAKAQFEHVAGVSVNPTGNTCKLYDSLYTSYATGLQLQRYYFYGYINISFV